jgi:predicted regulator of Ras-like GTPase activity (Roadblock/LC7/MglB family)
VYQPRPDAAYIQQRLYELQRGYPVVHGLMIVSAGGIVLASTFGKEDNVSRLAAVTRTLYLLGQDTCREFGRGEMTSVHLSYRRGQPGDDNTPTRVVIRSLTDDHMLVMVLGIPVAQTPRPPACVPAGCRTYGELRCAADHP